MRQNGHFLAVLYLSRVLLLTMAHFLQDLFKL